MKMTKRRFKEMNTLAQAHRANRQQIHHRLMFRPELIPESTFQCLPVPQVT
jgi:RNA-splicing ligase RtcB